MTKSVRVVVPEGCSSRARAEGRSVPRACAVCGPGPCAVFAPFRPPRTETPDWLSALRARAAGVDDGSTPDERAAVDARSAAVAEVVERLRSRLGSVGVEDARELVFLVTSPVRGS